MGKELSKYNDEVKKAYDALSIDDYPIIHEYPNPLFKYSIYIWGSIFLCCSVGVIIIIIMMGGKTNPQLYGGSSERGGVMNQIMDRTNSFFKGISGHSSTIIVALVLLILLFAKSS